MNIKERIRLIIDHICNADIGEYEILASLRAILRDLEAEPPKPTGEQLKAIGKVLDGDAPRECKDGDLIWREYGNYKGSQVVGTFWEQHLRWHLKDAPTSPEQGQGVDVTPAQMICNHAGECKTKCGLKIPHLEVPECRIIRKMVYSTGCPFPDAVCVPWVEPVKHYLCDGCHHEYSGIESQRCAACRDFDDINDAGQVYHQFWTPKQPEPVVKENFTAKEPKAEPGLIGCKIVGGKGNELWLVQRPAGAIALYKAVGRTDFAYIETEIGDKFISLQAFDDPPIRAWFRGAKGTPSPI